MEIHIYKDIRGLFRWRAVADNGRIVADSAESYVSRENAERAVHNFCEYFVQDTVMVVSEDE